jgi:hypothetical protein
MCRVVRADGECGCSLRALTKEEWALSGQRIEDNGTVAKTQKTRIKERGQRSYSPRRDNSEAVFSSRRVAFCV